MTTALVTVTIDDSTGGEATITAEQMAVLTRDPEATAGVVVSMELWEVIRNALNAAVWISDDKIRIDWPTATDPQGALILLGRQLDEASALRRYVGEQLFWLIDDDPGVRASEVFRFV